MKNRPCHTVRLGRIRAAIWKNATPNGDRYSVLVTKTYRNSNDEWKETSSFDRDDLLLVAKAADISHTWIISELQRDRSEETNG